MASFHFSSRNQIVTSVSQLEEIYSNMSRAILKKISRREVLETEDDHRIECKCEPIRSFNAPKMKLPVSLAGKQACINVHPEDKMCFT